MVTAFVDSSIFNKPIVLTSEARSIAAVTGKDRLSVSLTCSGVTFFTADLYAYDGKVELFDPGALIENFFISRQLIRATVTVTFGTVSENIMFLYCENDMPASFNPANVLLLSSHARRVHEDSQFTFAALPAAQNTPFVIKAVGHDCDGHVARTRFDIPVNIADALFTEFSVEDIVSHAITGTLQEFGPLIENALVDVMYFSVEHAGRQLMCYITAAPAYLTFRFRNIFNVPEIVDIEGSMVTKSATSRKDAVCAGEIVKYDRNTDRTYQVTTGPLPADEVESLAQLFSSHSLQILADGTYHDVVIEESSFEDSTDDDSLTTVKFTWRFKGRRPVNFTSALFGIRPSNREIFSDEYSTEYE